jgi:anti-sigma factor RsiW
VTRPAAHFDDELLSALVDGQVLSSDRARVQAHLETCPECAERLEELHTLVGMLRALPDVLPTRDFRLGPRAVLDPPNLVRLRRWYVATRIAAGSLAAVFVLLSAGVLYVDSRQAPATAPRGAEVARAPAAAPVAPTAAPAIRAAAPAVAAQPSPPPAPAGAQTSDQVAALTSINPLPTPVPTSAPAPIPQPIPAAVATSTDAAAPLRAGAITVGVLAVLALLSTAAVRHRLQRSDLHP